MNLLLLTPDHFINDHEAQLDERQRTHVLGVIKPNVGDFLTVGKMGGKIGRARVSHADKGDVRLDQIECINEAPAPLPLTLLLAMPRPQQLKRILQTVATMGVTKLCFIQTQRAEKSFWQSPSATDKAIREQLILGLEQGKATHMPTIEKHVRFKPFAEDILPSLAENTLKWVAHPGDYPCVDQIGETRAATLAIGPEGGFIASEIALLEQQGFEARQLGSRILKVETAVTALIAKMY